MNMRLAQAVVQELGGHRMLEGAIEAAEPVVAVAAEDIHGEAIARQ